MFCFECNSVEYNSIKEWCLRIMLSYCRKCGENTKSIGPLFSKAINSGTIISKCAVCNTKKSKIYEKTRSKRIIK